MFGCKHQWEFVDKTFTPSPLSLDNEISIKQGTLPNKEFMALCIGVTNITQRCTKCKVMSVIQTSGKA